MVVELEVTVVVLIVLDVEEDELVVLKDDEVVEHVVVSPGYVDDVVDKVELVLEEDEVVL